MSGWGTIYNNTRMALHTNARELARLQEQAASGARVNRASDDPSDAYRIMKLRAQSQSLDEYSKNLQNVTRTLEQAHGVAQEISGNIHTVVQKLEQAASGIYSESNRHILGEEVNAILEQVLALANTKSLGRYLFSGSMSDSQSYVVQTDGQYVTEVRYAGSRDDLLVPIAPGVEMSGVLVGETTFRSHERQAPDFQGKTGAAAGTGTANIQGNAYLELTHDATTVINDPDGVNLAVSADLTVTDTILGEHELVVDVTENTIKFVGGPKTSFTGTETALEVRNLEGDVVYVDVTGLNGALVAPATVTVRSDGFLSLDGGPQMALTDFTDDNLAVYDDQGGVLYVDATGIRRTGLEAVHVPGTHDLFDTLIDTRDILLNTRGLGEAEQLELLRGTSGAIREVLDNITRTLTSVGGRLQALDTFQSSMNTIQATADDQAGALENADLVQVAADLARTQALYQMTLATASKLLNLSLLDFI
jgi:flagellar hook-associated protein 3 FlgL